MSDVNDIQIGGDHYKAPIQHWDFVTANGLGYLEACATKYITRWEKKHNYPQMLVDIAKLFGVDMPSRKQDLLKSLHYIEKMISVAEDGGLRQIGTPNIPWDAFCDANNVSDDEAEVVRLVTNWQSIRDLRQAKVLVESIISLYARS